MLINTLFSPGDTVYVWYKGKVRKRIIWWLSAECRRMSDEVKIFYHVSAKSPWATVEYAEAEAFATEAEARIPTALAPHG